MNYLSLFSGIEAATVAWRPLGWTCVGVAEVEPFPRQLLKHHYPEVPQLGDITKITEQQIKALGHIDLVVGGFPCQDLSVAGKRAGFQGERSVLFFDAMRIVRWSRARWVVVENVPGLFSSHHGRDFAAVVGAMAGAEFDVPRDGWRNAGAAVGPEGLVEWATLDAQFFGLAQRRKRVFVIRDSGAWRDRPPVLLEPEGVRGDPPPRRKAREGTAAGTLRSSDGGLDVHAAAGHIVEALPEVVGALCDGAHMGGGLNGQDAYSGRIIPHAVPILEAGARAGANEGREGAGVGEEGDPMFTLQASKQHAVAFKPSHYTRDKDGAPSEVAPPLSADADKGDQDTVVMTPIALMDERNVTSPDNRASCDASGPTPTMHEKPFAIAFTAEQTPKFSEDVTLTLTKQSPTGGGQPQYVLAPALTSSNDPSRSPQSSEITQQVAAVVEATAAFAELADPVAANQARTYTREGANNFRVSNVAIQAMQVRRLTPRECERLQGFEDDYTLIPGKLAADGPRYKALGNSMATTVMAWIGRQIQRAHDWE